MQIEVKNPQSVDYQELTLVQKPKQESLLDFVSTLQNYYQGTISKNQRKSIGQYFTPLEVARFMAGMFSQIPTNAKILDPGAGAGMLSAAICERVLNSRKKHKLEFHLYEIDPAILPVLQRTADYCRKSLEGKGHQVKFIIHAQDFVVHNAKSLSGQQKLNADNVQNRFDLVVMNPPYFKLNKNSTHAKLMSVLFKGQPNIYAQFMALGAHFLCATGELVAITPRSYCNGLYFKSFRKYFLQTVKPEKFHIFDSRNKAFDSDDVLQENIIICAKKTSKIPDKIQLTASDGHQDLESFKLRRVPYNQVIHTVNDDTFIRIVSDTKEVIASKLIDSFKQTFLNAGYRISTGPVVSFRLKQHLRFEETKNTVPLITIHNVQPFEIVPHKKTNKPSFFAINAQSANWATPVGNYVLLRRFTTKEENRRLTAAVLFAKNIKHSQIAFENHLNYIYKANGKLSEDEAYGLAALFNSRIYDDYFRAISGNTQVNAHEIKNIKLPNNDLLLHIGKSVRNLETHDALAVEKIVYESLQRGH